MISKLKKQNTWGECLEKLNEVINAVNKLETMAKNTNAVLESLVVENNMHEKQIDELQMKLEPEKCEIPRRNMRPPYMQNKRLRKALSIAQSALVKLANDAYDFDEHIYIDKILNQIESITKGGDNE